MSKLIEAESKWQDRTLTEISHDNIEAIRELLLGHRVQKIAADHMMLDDGTVVRIVPNSGCACPAGNYELTDLNECDNIITSVEVVDEELPDRVGEDYYEDGHVYRVFVVAEDKRINLFAVTGDDGNGYYGTGYVLLVRRP